MDAPSIARDRAQQQRTIAFLSDPASYGQTGNSVERIDTHGAIIFLAGPSVYKIKRAVQFRYLDFSSLEKREAVCRRELEINQPCALQIYHGVVPITQESNGQLRIAGTGKPVEWAIHMRRFDQSALLANRVKNAELSPALAHATAQQILKYHRLAPSTRRNNVANDFGEVIDDVCSNLQRQDQAHGELIQALCNNLKASHQQVIELLNERGRAGFVVRGHGDLHLSNIVVLDEEPVLFDALEFDESLATVDVLYDLAFLLMDLDMRGRRASANAIFNRYIYHADAIENVDGLRAMPLFLALRAAVRAMVAMQLQAINKSKDPVASAPNAVAYLRYAARSLSAPAAQLVAVGGFSGTGKSTVARGLAPDLGAAPGALHIRSDWERKARWHVPELTRLPSSAYSASQSAMVYELVLEKAELALKAGHSVIVDAVFADAGQRDQLTELANRCAVTFQGIWLDGSPAVLRKRISERNDDASDATSEVLAKQLARETGVIKWNIVDADGDAQDTLSLAKRALGLTVRRG